MQDEIRTPRLYETEPLPVERKTIYQHWTIPQVNFHWLIAEYDPHEEIAFGYCNLNDREMAEWGYVSWKEVSENGGIKNETWKPCRFPKALERIKAEFGADV